MSKKAVTFESALNKLEELVLRLESGEIGLDDSLKKFEEGQELIKFCLDKLNKAETRIRKLQKDKDGNLQVALFDQENE